MTEDPSSSPTDPNEPADTASAGDDAGDPSAADAGARESPKQPAGPSSSPRAAESEGAGRSGGGGGGRTRGGERPDGRPPRSRFGIGVILAVGIVLAIGACCVFSMLATMVGPQTSMGPQQLTERTVDDGEGLDKLVLVEVDGMIARNVAQGGLFPVTGPDLVERVERQLEAAAQDPQAKGVLLRIDSPGGTVSASDAVWHHVKTFREEHDKPVVVHMGAVCASGGYYIAAAADEIVCEPTTITGSIGVVLSTLNFSELLQEYGVEDVTLTSGPNKDLLNPTAPVREDHKEILEGMIEDTYQRFVEIVADGRGMELARVKELADGRIFTARQAEDNGLVDDTGYREDSRARLAELAGVPKNARLVEYAPPPSLADVLSGNVQASVGRGPSREPGVTVRLDPGLLDRLRRPRLLALWRPR